MDHIPFGSFIAERRKALGLTQKELAEQLNVTDKAVSKWETGLGRPDLSLLPPLSKLLGTSIEELLSPLPPKDKHAGDSIRSLAFFYCPQCGNLISAGKQTLLSCCGRTLLPLIPQKPDDAHYLTLEPVEDEWFVTTPHPMEKDHYLCFASVVGSDQILTIKRWPEWDFQLRIPRRGHSFLYWYCTKHGLFRQVI